MQKMFPKLPMRWRKLIGAVVLLLWVIFYALLIATLAVSPRVPQSGFGEFLFYAVAGLAWTPPAAALIWWMQKPDA